MPQLPKPEKPSSFRVLLVDDHPGDASRTRKLLSELPGQPFELTWVSHSAEALSVLRAGGWSACLLNHRLDAGEGLDLLRAVTGESGETPVILFTQHADPQLDVLAVQEGAADSIARDELTPRLLERTIRHAIERQRLQQETQRELRERRRAEAAVRSIIAKARCLLWEADVEDDGSEALRWRPRFFDQDAAAEFLQLDLSGVPSLPHDWLRSRLPDDRARTDAHEDDRIRRGESYTQEFRYYTLEGEIRCLREDVKVEVVAPGRWRLVGVCTDVTERRRTEEALRESHAILKGVAEGTTDAVFVKNLEGRYIMINSAGAQFIGRPAEEIVGRHDTELFSPDTVRDVLRSDQAVFRTGRTDSFEETLTAAGITRTYHATKGPLIDPDGKIIGIIGVSREITARKQAELALRESEERFRTMAECAPVGIYLTDVSGGNIYSNPALQQQTGRSSEELAGDRWTSMLHPDDIELVAGAWRAALADGSSYDVTFRCVHPDGTLTWIHTKAAAVRDGDKPLGYVGLTVDITAQREAVQALRESEARYRFQAHLLGAIGQAVIAMSLDRTIFYSNRAAEQL
ncbi:MAG: PAS domain S-box protein, partial [Actinomycetota bacterium]